MAVDKSPPSLGLSREAIEVIAAPRSVDLSITVDAGRLTVLHPAEKLCTWIWMEGDVYVEGGNAFRDALPNRYTNMELLAWRATGLLFLPRHYAPAAEWVRRQRGDPSRIPIG